MTALITRQEIVKTKKIIDSELAKVQRAVYDENTFNDCEDEDEKTEYLVLFDLLDHQHTEINSHSKTIGLNHSDINTFTSKLSFKLIELFKILGVNEFFIISHLKLDFFGNRSNKFEPLVKAYERLEQIVGKATYKDAFKIDLIQLADFIDILFWITRCDPSTAEYILLFDVDQKIQMHICQYGNIHVTEFHHENLSDKLLASLDWTIIDGKETDNFLIDNTE